MNDITIFIFKAFKEAFRNLSRKTLELNYEKILNQVLQENNLSKDDIESDSVIKQWFKYVNHFDFILGLPDLNETQEIIIHNQNHIDLVYATKRTKLNVEFLGKQDLHLAYDIMARRYKIEWNYKNPFASFLIDVSGTKYRCSIVHESITQRGCAKLFLRNSSSYTPKLKDFKLDEKLEKLLINFTKEKKNIIIAGSTASGKTSFIKSLTEYFDQQEHVLVIEDTHEIPGPINQFTHLLSKNTPGKTMKDYCEYGLRMSPDRIILGEMRSHEIIPFILSMNTGHRGLMSTIHANSAFDTLNRMGTLFSLYSSAAQNINYEQVMKMICQNVEVVIFLEKKEVSEIIEVKGCEKALPIYSTLYKKETIGNSSQKVIQLDSYPQAG